MKIEIRQAEIQQQRLPGKRALAARKFHRDLLVFAACYSSHPTRRSGSQNFAKSS
jgi:hypothetical protein